ncbi:hypothetical protein CVT26_015474 [Gymnopilus dilepis]|uniref:Uncharacterized protein n=1 Tax=Gymnopilus dilepis TaxID=231916 RepID=A0A409WA71_9AGAR|nr:hypothetical protein CVT26_015474 [Gymnopilus dilepis]
MRFSAAVFATVLAFGASALATVTYPSMHEIIARHENDLRLQARGEMTEFEARAAIHTHREPAGECHDTFPQRMGAHDCLKAGGAGWKIVGKCYDAQQMLLQGNQIKGLCYF